jgi:hypothetical protein
MRKFTEITMFHERIIKHADGIQSLLHFSYSVIALMDG